MKLDSPGVQTVMHTVYMWPLKTKDKYLGFYIDQNKNIRKTSLKNKDKQIDKAAILTKNPNKPLGIQ
jgi:hypothetical protein